MNMGDHQVLQFNNMNMGEHQVLPFNNMNMGYHQVLPFNNMNMGDHQVLQFNNMNMGEHQVLPFNNMNMGYHQVLPFNNMNMGVHQVAPPPNNMNMCDHQFLPFNNTNMGDHQVVLSPGFRFVPTDQELVCYYLRNKVIGQPLPAMALNVIRERNLYGNEEPSEYGDPNGDRYFFTKIKNKFATSSRIDRTAGKGTWRIQNSPCVYAPDGTTPLGFNKTLNFIPDDVAAGAAKSWIMHEYTLPEDQYPQHDGAAAEQWALCRIRTGRGDKATKSKPPYNYKPAASSSSKRRPPKRARVEKNTVAADHHHHEEDESLHMMSENSTILSSSASTTTAPAPPTSMLVDAVPTETPTTPTYITSDNIALQFPEQCQQQEPMQQPDIPPSGSGVAAAATTPDHEEPQQPQQPWYKMDTNDFYEGSGTALQTAMISQDYSYPQDASNFEDVAEMLLSRELDDVLPPPSEQWQAQVSGTMPPSGVELFQQQQQQMQQQDIPPSAVVAATPDHQEPQQPHEQPWYMMDTNVLNEGSGTVLQTTMISQGSDLQDASWIDDFTQRMLEDDCYCSNAMISLDELSRKLDEDLPPPSEQWQAQVSGTAAAGTATSI